MRAEEYDELKKEIIERFKDKDFDYEYSDRLQVALHEILDDWVTNLGESEVNDCLSDFSIADMETLDRGMYEGVLKERGLDVFHKVLLYCLIEQDLYNEDDFNELQFKTRIAGITLK